MLRVGDTDSVEKKDLARKKTFPEILKYQRELRGWSQAKMSEEIGATPNRISLWERGMALPGAYFREKLCICLNMDTQELGLLTVDDKMLSDMPVDEQAEEQSQIVLPAVPDALAERKLQDQPDATKNWPHRSMTRRGLSRTRLLLALVLVLLLLLVGLMASFDGVFNHVLNSGQANPYPPYAGQLVLHDELRDQSSGVAWQEGSNDQGASCVFKAGGYVAFQPVAGYFHACMAQKTDYTNFSYEVLMTIQQGEFGGIVFRSEDSIDGHYYIFRVHTDGSYWLYRFADRNIDHATQLDTGTAPSLHKGLNKTNRLSVVAQGSLLTLYINGQEVSSLQDAGYTHGQIGVLAGSLNQGPAQALFQDAQVWN
jgi:transcriptional regulator with XRE-family HTH domain